MRKKIVYFLIMLLSMGILVGCSNKTSGYEEGTDEKKTKAETTVETEAGTTEYTTEEITTEETTTEEITTEEVTTTKETTTEILNIESDTADIAKFIGVWHSPAEDFGDWGHSDFWIVINDDLTYGYKGGDIIGTLVVVDENTLMDMESSDKFNLNEEKLFYSSPYGECCIYYREGQEP